MERDHLLDRLGMFGVRLAVALIRQGAAPNATTLSTELVRRSERVSHRWAPRSRMIRNRFVPSMRRTAGAPRHVTGASQASLLEWGLVLAAAVVLVWALGLALRYTVRPGETDPGHIKRRILADETDEAEEARPQ